MAAATVLGKRKLGAQPAALGTRKRRVLRPAVNDENADPETLCDADDGARVSGCEQLDSPLKSANGCSPRKSRPAKHSVQAGRVAASPIQINEHCKASSPLSGLHSYNLLLGQPDLTVLDSLYKTQLATPQTPRHRDALSKLTTPRQKVQVTSRLPLTPRTPRTPQSASRGLCTIYNSARQLFVRSAQPGHLVGRDGERRDLRCFLDEAVSTRCGRCLYVSGPPGTGKSAFVGQVCEEFKGRAYIRMAYINCMSIQSSKDVYTKIIKELGGNESRNEAHGVAALKAMFFPKKQASELVYIVTLDEIDHLLTLDLEILYTLFEWSLNPSSRLVLLGIANALDLTDRFLPRLKSRNLKPQLLPFVPYTVPQIVSVITTRLQSLSSDSAYVPFVHPTAIQFCAKKVASQTGDLRKAFDLVRRTIDIIESETKASHSPPPQSSPLGENPNLSSPSSSTASKSIPQDPLAHLTSETAPRATIAHAARVSASAFNNGTTSRLKGLNLQQKAALCSLLALEKNAAAACKRVATASATPSKSNSRLPTVRRLHEVYGGLCRREGKLAPLEKGEFADVVGSLEVAGLVKIVEAKGKVLKGRREEMGVSGLVSEKEVEGCLEGVVGGLLRGLLDGDDF